MCQIRRHANCMRVNRKRYACRTSRYRVNHSPPPIPLRFFHGKRPRFFQTTRSEHGPARPVRRPGEDQADATSRDAQIGLQAQAEVPGLGPEAQKREDRARSNQIHAVDSQGASARKRPRLRTTRSRQRTTRRRSRRMRPSSASFRARGARASCSSASSSASRSTASVSPTGRALCGCSTD